ncbi:MAG: HAMP domain-containing protein [Candidatus Omnitrophica bacterium]|nr:HAMP domain-containing protein [Candidatus Omnitrophota bacterium]
MFKLSRFLSSFRVKVALVMIASLLFAATLGNYFIFKFAFNSNFNQLRDKLKVIAQTAALAIDAGELTQVPLDREGINSPAYRQIVEKLIAIKQANSGIKFIYTMAKTGEEGILEFLVDPDALNPRPKNFSATSYPGDRYDARQFPELLNAFKAPSADKKIASDEWGRFLSAYAPVRDPEGRAVAILGVDMAADDVYLAEKSLLQRGIAVLAFGIIFSLTLGIFISRGVTKPIAQLVEATRRIAKGELDYQVNIKGKDEIAELAGAFNGMAASIAEANRKMHDYFYRAMQSLVRLLEAKDLYTKGHSDRVADFAEKTAKAMGLPVEKVEMLKRAAELHDIGKLGIDERILNKTTPLTDEEFALIREHPHTGEEILEPIAFDKELIDMVRSHHERYDGKGYPNKVKGEDLELICQIIPIADSYDAMTSNRAYRAAMSREEAINRLKAGSGTQFNPQVLEAFLKII